LGLWEILLLAVSVAMVIGGIALPIRPLTALQNMLTESKAGWREVLLLAVSIGLTLVIGDLLLRSFLPPSYPKTRYGWQQGEHHVRVSTVEDTTGQFREVTARYFTHGFKRWGDPNSGKRKLLILGDSMTEAYQVSNGEEWYAYLEGISAMSRCLSPSSRAMDRCKSIWSSTTILIPSSRISFSGNSAVTTTTTICMSWT